MLNLIKHTIASYLSLYEFLSGLDKLGIGTCKGRHIYFILISLDSSRYI